MSDDKDLNWLYRREVPQEPEPTVVMPMPMPEEPVRPRRRPAAAAVPPAHHSPTPRPRRRHPLRWAVLTLLVGWLAFLVGTPAFAWFVTTSVDAAPDGERPAEQPGSTVLLVGSDARENSNSGARADTMMLLHVPADGKSVLVSLPRDSLVSIPGRDHNKLNAAYAFGGPELLVQTVEQNTGVRIDGYLEIGFAGVVGVVDAVGGIEVCPAFDIDDPDLDLTVSQGCQTVDGKTALAYARMRKSDPKGDLGRVERQREVIAAITKEAVTPASVLNPVRYWRLNMAAAASLARGSDTGPLDMASVGLGFGAATTGAGISMTLPVAGTDNVGGVGSVVRWDEEASAKVFAALAAGDTTGLDS